MEGGGGGWQGEDGWGKKRGEQLRNTHSLTPSSFPPPLLPLPPLTHSQRAHLLERTDQLQKSSDRLEEGIRIARETEEIGMDVMDTLQRDRETIQRMRGRVRRGGG